MAKESNASVVLLLGPEEDAHVRAVRQAVIERGRRARVLDAACFPWSLTLDLDPATRRGRIGFPDGIVEYPEIRSVYWRSYAGVAEPSTPDDAVAAVQRHDSRGLFESLFRLLPARWVNGEPAVALHRTKPVQLATVVALGAGSFRVPRTHFGNDPGPLREFARSLGAFVGKGVQGGSATRRLRLEDLHDLSFLRQTPLCLQEYVPGRDLRVFVFADRLWACTVESDLDDHRLDPDVRCTARELELGFAEDCRRIARALGLCFAGLDFREDPDGGLWFLEANPSPMFLGFERRTGLPLTDSLVDLLTQ